MAAQTPALAIYLRDHHAGAVAGRALARRIASRSRTTHLAQGTAAVANEIAADFETLEDVMSALGIERSVVKDLGATVFEKLARLKPNGGLRGATPLSRVLELEALAAGITGKAALWRTLVRAAEQLPALERFDFAALHERALGQRDRVESFREAVDLAAFLDTLR